jgi:HlyD family secretion protein
MDIQRKNVGRNKAIRWSIIGVVVVGVVAGLVYWVTRLKPAAPPAEMSALWPDTVKRGPMVREVRGLGTLVPEDTMLITANTDARIERILIKPGTPVRADSLVMVMTSPELETALLDAQYLLKASEADY